MTISALYGVIDYSRTFWMYLVAHIAVMTVLYKYLDAKFYTMIKPNYRALFAREWTINIATPMIIGTFVTLAINGYEPTYLQTSLEETWRTASSTVSSDCDVINYFLKLQKEIDSIFWWIMDSGTKNMEDNTLKIGIWISFLLINSFAILGINRFIAQVIYLLDKIFNKRKINESN
jgi:hypothetical protein